MSKLTNAYLVHMGFGKTPRKNQVGLSLVNVVPTFLVQLCRSIDPEKFHLDRHAHTEQIRVKHNPSERLQSVKQHPA